MCLAMGRAIESGDVYGIRDYCRSSVPLDRTIASLIVVATSKLEPTVNHEVLR